MDYTIELKTNKRNESIEITNKVEDIISKSKLSSGLCIIYSPHTTSAIDINESYDPSVVEDIHNFLLYLIPQDNNYKHLEGNSDAHIKSSIIGNSRTLIIQKGRLVLGKWQGIFFMEFDGPRSRTIHVKLIKG